MKIKLTDHAIGPHPVGSEHEVVSVVPHGGHTDSAQQYVLADGTYVASDYADVVEPRLTAPLDLQTQRRNAAAAAAAALHRARALRFTDEGQGIWS